MKVTRLICYEGEDEWVRKTLEKSLLKKVGVGLTFGVNKIKLLKETVNGSDQGSWKNTESEDEGRLLDKGSGPHIGESCKGSEGVGSSEEGGV